MIKVDAEGHEGAELDRMRSLFCDKGLHCVGFGMHFGILQERWERRRPREITQAMEAKRFPVQWTDMSYIIAVRKDL